jgi:polar amino acid transport system substrate-binding protein
VTEDDPTSRDDVRPTSKTIVATAAGAMLLAACGAGDAGNGDTEPLTADGEDRTIRVAFANERPYGFEEDGEATGQSPSVAREVLSRMGYDDVETQVVDFDALINGLNAGQYDLVAAGMWINENRVQQALFTDPDYCDTTAFAVPDGNPDGLSDYQSVIDNGVTIGVMSGAVQHDDAMDSGIPEDQLTTFSSPPDLLDALQAGRVDAYALTNVTVVEQMEDTDGFEATEGFVPVVDGEERLGCGGYVFRFEDLDFRDEFNEVLLEMRENDELAPLVEEFGFSQEQELDAAKGLTVEDLAGVPYDVAVNGGDDAEADDS